MKRGAMPSSGSEKVRMCQNSGYLSVALSAGATELADDCCTWTKEA